MRRVMVLFVGLAVALVVLLAIKVTMQQREATGAVRGNGTVEGTQIDLRSRLMARVREVHVRKGARVEKDALLVSLECTEASAALQEAEARYHATQAQAQAARASAVAARGSASAAAAQAEAARAQAAALEAQHGAAKRQAERLRELGEDASLAMRDQTTSQAEGLSHQLQAARQASAASGYNARAAAQQDAAMNAQAQAAQLAIDAAQAAVARARELVAECSVRAPRAALVEDVFVEVGELVTPGALTARLVDTSDLRATFYVANADLASAQPGLRAAVRADAYPGEQFAAEVVTVSALAEFTPRNIQTRSDRDRLVYPVEVRIEDARGLLRPGMPVEVTLGGAAVAPGVAQAK